MYFLPIKKSGKIRKLDGFPENNHIILRNLHHIFCQEKWLEPMKYVNVYKIRKKSRNLIHFWAGKISLLRNKPNILSRNIAKTIDIRRFWENPEKNRKPDKYLEKKAIAHEVKTIIRNPKLHITLQLINSLTVYANCSKSIADVWNVNLHEFQSN